MVRPLERNSKRGGDERSDRYGRCFDTASQPERPSTAGEVLTTRFVHQDGRALYVHLGFALLKDRS